MSDFTLTDDGGSVLTILDRYSERRLVAALLSLISLAGVIGNSVVLLAPVLSRKPRKPTNVFVVNLAVADIFVCLCMPIFILALLSENRETLIVSKHLCALVGFVLIVCTGCSINNIAAIALYRALITSRNNRSDRSWLFDRRCLAAIVTTTWVIPFSVGLLPVLSEFGSYDYDDKLGTCSYNPTAPGSGTFSKISTAAFYPVQLLVTLVSSVYIGVKLRRHQRRINAAQQHQGPALVGEVMRLPGRSDPGTSQERSQSSVQPVPTTYRRALRATFWKNLDVQVTLTLSLVVVVFVMCYAPYFFTVIVFKTYIHYLGVLFIFNSCINPVIYTARHPDFKDVCRCIMLCRHSKIPRKSSFLQSVLRFRE